MIYIEDYRSLPGFPVNRRGWDLTELLGQTITARTDTGAYTGVAVGEDSHTLTLACIRTSRNRRERRKVVISKLHITAIETRLR